MEEVTEGAGNGFGMRWMQGKYLASEELVLLLDRAQMAALNRHQRSWGALRVEAGPSRSLFRFQDLFCHA